MCVQTDMKANVLAVFGFSVVINVYGTKCKYFIPRSATKWVKFANHLQANEIWGGVWYLTSGFLVQRSKYLRYIYFMTYTCEFGGDAWKHILLNPVYVEFKS